MWRGWALVELEQGEEGIVQIHQGIAASRVTGIEIGRSGCFALLAWAYARIGKREEGLRVLTDALAVVDNAGEQLYEAELYQLKGELTLQSSVQRLASPVPNTQHLVPRWRWMRRDVFSKPSKSPTSNKPNFGSSAP